MSEGNQNDILHLQEKISHQERQIQDLDDSVIAQGKEISDLRNLVVRLESKIEYLEQRSGGDGGIGDDDAGMTIADIAARDKPPHY